MKRVLLVGSGAYGSLIQEAATGLKLNLTVDDGRNLDFKERPEEYVIIATPNFTHFDLVSRASIAGKHVLCEKPLALTAKEVRELYRLALDQKKYLGVGFVLPNHTYYQVVKEKQRENGSICMMRVYNHATEGELKPEWYWNEAQSGGWFMIAEIHWYHLYFWLTNSQDFSVDQALESTENGRTVATWSRLQTDKKQTLTIDHRLDMNQQNHWTKVEVVYENGDQIVLDDWVPRVMTLPGGQVLDKYELAEWRAANRLATYQDLIRKNIEQLLEGKPVTMPREILLAHEAAEDAQKLSAE